MSFEEFQNRARLFVVGALEADELSLGPAPRRDRTKSTMNAASTMSDRMPNGSSQTSGARPGKPSVRLIT